MNKFCSECGFGLSNTASFCGGCGATVSKSCPTCGQVLPPSVPQKNGKSSILISSGPKSKKTSTARTRPIYGSKYDKEYDCSNCGAKDQNYKMCKQCSEDNE